MAVSLPFGCLFPTARPIPKQYLLSSTTPATLNQPQTAVNVNNRLDVKFFMCEACCIQSAFRNKKKMPTKRLNINLTDENAIADFKRATLQLQLYGKDIFTYTDIIKIMSKAAIANPSKILDLSKA